MNYEYIKIHHNMFTKNAVNLFTNIKLCLNCPSLNIIYQSLSKLASPNFVYSIMPI